jgi:ribonuclease P protein component
LTLPANALNGPSIGAAACGAAFSFEFVFEGMSDEAHLPAEQPCPGTPSRLPVAHGDRWRSRSDPRTPRTRSQEAVGLTHLKKRSDFLAANAGRRAAIGGLVLLVRDRCDGSPAMRVGFTVTKKIGNAVTRNRMKRRFRALARELLPQSGVAGADHVVIGRQSGVERDYADLRKDLQTALKKAAR